MALIATASELLKTMKACLLVLLLVCTGSFAQENVIYPASESNDDSRHGDLIELLNSALEKTVAEYGPYRIAPSRLKMNEQRSLYELRQGELVNVVWSPTSIDMEKQFIPIRVPLRKGLLGLRIALIDAKNQALIDRVKNLSDLQNLNVGQGIGWGDLHVYNANGIAAITASYDSLFKMVTHDRFYLYPRGINEIFEEFERRRSDLPTLAIEKNLIISYPWPYYFFVSKNNIKLASRLDLGLHRMVEDGSFDKIFWKYNGHAIRSANLEKRRVIQLHNPLLPADTPRDRRYWFFSISAK